MEASPNPSIVLSSSTDDDNDDESSTRPPPALSEATFITSNSTSTHASTLIGLPDRPQSSGPRLLNELGSLNPRSSPLLPGSSLGDPDPLTVPKTTTRSLNAVDKLQADRAHECGDDLLTPTEGKEESKQEKKLEAESNWGGEGLGSGGTGVDASPSQPQELEAPACLIEDSGFSRGQKGRSEEKENGEGRESQGFDRFKTPTKDKLRAAGACLLTHENGCSVPFDSLVKAREKVVVVFLRHLWCGLCAQYVVALKSETENLAQVSTSQLSTESMYTPPPLYILLISSGSPSLIPIYQQRLGCPFPLVVDKGRKLDKTLGMTLKTLSLGKEEEKGSYMTKSNLGNVIVSARNGLAMRRYPGSQKQLGGEFVMVWNDETEQMECTYASRMNTISQRGRSLAAFVRDFFEAQEYTWTALTRPQFLGESQHEGS